MKKWIITAVALVVAGLILCAVSTSSARFDFGKLGSEKYETNTYAVKDGFRSISVDATTEKLVFKPSEDGRCTVVCLEEENRKHEVAVTDGTLTVKTIEKRKPFLAFGISVQSPEITVCLPERVYAGLRIETDTGDVRIPADFSFDSIAIRGDTADVSCLASAASSMEIELTTGDISLSSVTVGSLALKTTTGGISVESVKCEGEALIRVDTGRVTLRELSCKALTSEGDTGSIILDRVLAADSFTIRRETGDVQFIGSDAAAIFVETDTGDVKGSLLTDKVFITRTDTGKVEVPDSVTGGRCEISTDTGDIRITVG